MNEQEQQTEQAQQQILQNPQVTQYETPPPNYLVIAILTTIFCCQIFGIVSIVYAASVNSKWASGDKQGAYNASKNAKTWALIGIGSAVFAILLTILLIAFGVFMGTDFQGIDI